MNGAWLAASIAGLAALFAGLSLAAGDRDRLIGRIEPPAPAAAPRASGDWLPRSAAQLSAWAVLGCLAGAGVAGVPGGVLLPAGAVLTPALVRRRRRGRLVRLLGEQMIDAVGVMASALRTGRSLAQSLELAGTEVDSPLGPALACVADRIRLGVRQEEAILGWERSLGTPEARLVAGVLRLHGRTGGALAVALDDLAETLRDRLSGDRELRTMTAQARLSAAILGLLPLGFFLFLSIVSRSDIESAFRTRAGAAAIAVGLGLQGLAFLWIRRLLRIEP